MLKLSIKSIHLFLIIFAFLMLYPYQINAEFIYIGNFEDGNLNEWIPYTNDDIAEKGD